MKALISLNAFQHNLMRIRTLSPACPVVAMVKANAYGHGLVATAQFLASEGVSHFGVATIEEGETLRRAGIEGVILLMSGAGFLGHENRLLTSKITPLVSSLEELKALNALQAEMPIHIDVDTGMSRGGFLVTEVPGILSWWLQEKRHLKLEGMSTHFSDARAGNHPVSKAQLEEFRTALQLFEQAGLSPPVVHIANSSVLINLKPFHWKEVWVRPGIALYGAFSGFRPVMSLQAEITLLKTIRVGATVGYYQTWTAARDTRVALIRAGYGDGYPRVLSNQGHALIRGQRVPVIGRVSMDLITLDVTDFPCQVGDWVTLMGQEGNECITANAIAEASGTISYEILTGISERVDRIYV